PIASKLALLKYKKGDLQAATKGMVEALEAAMQFNDLHVIAYSADDAAQVAAQPATQRMAGQNVAGEQDLEKMARVLGAVDHWRQMLSLHRSPRGKSVNL